VSANDLLEYWEKDPRTRVILLYPEEAAAGTSSMETVEP
jgi:acyl-CoA synthetase (NDP forming)